MPFPVDAATLLSDSFNNGTPATVDAGNPNLVGAWQIESGRLITESAGALTVSTATSGGGNTSAYAEGKIWTAVSPNLNIFTTAIQVKVRDFSQAGTGDYVDSENFRLGLMARTLTSTGLNFYNTDDGVALRINNDGRTYSLTYKLNQSSVDPGSTSGMVANPGSTLPSGTLPVGSAITGFDLEVSSTAWSLSLYTESGGTVVHSGTWNLGDGSTWGNETEGWGNSALLLYAQNARANLTDGTPAYAGTSSFTIGSIEVNAVPEPARGVLLLAGSVALAMRRSRRA